MFFFSWFYVRFWGVVGIDGRREGASPEDVRGPALEGVGRGGPVKPPGTGVQS